MTKPILIFFALAYALGWLPILLLSWLAQRAGLDSWLVLATMAETWTWDGRDVGVPYGLLYFITRVQDFAFSISGVIVVAWLYGGAGVRNLFAGLIKIRLGAAGKRIWLLACLPFVFYFLATVAVGAVGSFTFSINDLFPLLFSLETGLLVTFLLRGPMGEELGLRGFALVHLQKSMTAIRASTIIGLFWALWHLPVLIDRDLLSIIAFLLLAFGLSFVFTWLFNNSAGSLLPVMIFHTLQNNEETFEILFPALQGGNYELISLLCLIALSVFAFIRLRRSDQQRTTPTSP
ncbi:CPBP family intramembrane glutamic endopeptidase [Pseudohongiella sp.]|uniref:CAAX prenyl protease 2/Lysostaphin resistance protein A-like domain-containing protein n=1 Tax=marine sediment metagenome TaxID=412755 RepID=A0A0F9WIJ4_9ZZZZ|nr:CPBP family intramembrane glutamic endopeptidase [Pseudohongiella sp.]HDZ07486.1 CPBP family intramembrane metalloprotease [Pseudohongiella sp.]HEA63009.1 CPBP family intramembrane metalloprotease [Pseudohongiella sp.]